MSQNLSDACSVASVPVSKPAKSTDGDRFTMTTYQVAAFITGLKLCHLSLLSLQGNKAKSKIWLLS